MQTDTVLVEFLRLSGCSYNQAAQFERCLEDQPICGIGPGRLTLCIERFALKDATMYQALLNGLVTENKRLAHALDEQYRQGKFDFPL